MRISGRDYGRGGERGGERGREREREEKEKGGRGRSKTNVEPGRR